MIHQGTGGLSRGSLTEGVMQGHNFLDYVPLHLSALDQIPTICDWCVLWLPSTLNLQSLTPMGWFTTGHGTSGGLFNSDGIWIPTFMDPSQMAFLWCPTPTAADVAIKLLGYSGHKRLSFIHVFICPCSMTAIW